MPVLFSHFLEHSQLNSHIGFLDFLSMHYGGDDQNDDDTDRDMQLPFKSASQHSSSQITSVPVSFVTIETSYSDFRKPLQPVFAESYLIDSSVSSLFRPPRAFVA
jgi:hypothetical protein